MNIVFGMRTDTIVSLFGMDITWQAYLITVCCCTLSALITLWAITWVHDLYKAELAVEE